MATYLFGPGHSNPDDVAGKVKPGDVLQFVRGATGTTAHGISLASKCRVEDVGDKKQPPYVCNVLNKGSSFLAVPANATDVDIHGICGRSTLGGEGSVVNISGKRVHVSDIHASGNIRGFSLASSEDVTIDGGTMESGAIYPGGYLGSKTGDPATSSDPVRTVIRNLTIRMVGPQGLKGIRASREAGLLIEDVTVIGTGNPLARCAFDLKCPGDITVRRCHSIDVPTAFAAGPLDEGDGMSASDWKTVRTIHVLFEDCTAVNAHQAIDVHSGCLRVDIVRGNYQATQSGISVRGPYNGWDKAADKPIPAKPAPAPQIRPASPTTVTKSTVIKAPKKYAGMIQLITEV